MFKVTFVVMTLDAPGEMALLNEEDHQNPILNQTNQ